MKNVSICLLSALLALAAIVITACEYEPPGGDGNVKIILGLGLG